MVQIEKLDKIINRWPSPIIHKTIAIVFGKIPEELLEKLPARQLALIVEFGISQYAEGYAKGSQETRDLFDITL